MIHGVFSASFAVHCCLVWCENIVSKNIWEHVFHRRKTLTLSLKVFDSALERRYSQLHMHVFVWCWNDWKQLLPYIKHAKKSKKWHQMTCLSIEQMMFRSTCNHTKTRMCSWEYILSNALSNAFNERVKVLLRWKTCSHMFLLTIFWLSNMSN